VTAARLDRLARMLGMLGAAHDGEVVAAARQTERLRREAGATWPELLAPPLPEPTDVRVFDGPDNLFDYLERFACALTPSERIFARSMRRWRRRPTDKQVAVLQRISINRSALTGVGS
jgi:hypothetical protein